VDHHKPFPFVALDQSIAAEVDHFLTGANTLVAHTFAAFLHRVAEDWEAFLRDDRGWKYVSG